MYQRRPLGTARARALSLRAQLGGQLGRVKALSSSRFLGRTQPRSIAGRGSRVLSLSADGDTVYCATAAGEVVRFDDELREHERTVLPATDAGDVRATAVAAIDGGGCVCGDSAGRLHRMD